MNTVIGIREGTPSKREVNTKLKKRLKDFLQFVNEAIEGMKKRKEI